MKNKKEEILCEECGKKFITYIIESNRKKYCSKKCFIKNQGKILEKEFKWIVDSKTGCWNCVSHISKSKKTRYPRPKIRRNGKDYMIHQYAFLINKGYIPKLIMHTCDNLICVNPNHLKEGNNKKNSQDMVNKNRQAKGVDNGGGTKLNDEKAREIKRLLKKGIGTRPIAKQYNVSRRTIQFIKYNQHWKHVN